MPRYKLTYLNMPAIAEPIRWALKVSNVDFEDERIEFDDWDAAKATGKFGVVLRSHALKFIAGFPIGLVPLLEIDGQVYTQSGAILKYIGRKYGLTAGDELQDLRVEEAHDALNDAVELYRGWFRGIRKNDLEAINRFLIKFKDLLPSVLKQVGSFLEASKGDFLVGSKLTYGDLMLANWFQFWADGFPELALRENYPRLAKHEEVVLAIPQIKSWIQVRPNFVA